VRDVALWSGSAGSCKYFTRNIFNTSTIGRSGGYSLTNCRIRRPVRSPLSLLMQISTAMPVFRWSSFTIGTFAFTIASTYETAPLSFIFSASCRYTSVLSRLFSITPITTKSKSLVGVSIFVICDPNTCTVLLGHSDCMMSVISASTISRCFISWSDGAIYSQHVNISLCRRTNGGALLSYWYP
jgi:hypothetical protein